MWSAVGRTPAQFAISRFSRLYPIFWVAISITLYALWVFQGQALDLYRIFANMTMVAGYLNKEYIDGVYWTLQVELKFYVLVFILITLKQINNIDYWLIGWLAGCIAAPYIPIIASITIHPYGPYFIAGATLYLTWKERITPLRGFLLFICLILSLINTINVTSDYIFEQSSFDSTISALVVFGFYALMLAVALGHVKIGERQFLFRLAMMTYPLYLLHNILGRMVFDSLGTNKYISLFIALTLLLFLCYALAMYVDRPLNKISNRKLTALHNKLTNK